MKKKRTRIKTQFLEIMIELLLVYPRLLAIQLTINNHRARITQELFRVLDNLYKQCKYRN